MGLRAFLARVLGVRLGFRLDRVVRRHDAAEVLDAETRDVPEDLLLEDKVSVLHPDGSATGYFHVVARVRDPRILDEWEVQRFSGSLRDGLVGVRLARVLSPEGHWIPARQRRTTGTLPGGQAGELVDVVFLGLLPGCVLELEVQFERYGPGPYGPHVFGEMFMETASPCRLRRFALAVPRGRELWVDRYRYDDPGLTEEVGRYRVLALESRDARGRLVDPFTPAARDELPTVEVSTLSEWGPLVEGYLKQLAPVRSALPPALPGQSDVPDDPEGQALWAYEFVSREVRYGRAPDLLDNLAARAPSDTARELRGDCKDKVMLLSELLQGFGFETSFVLVETIAGSRRPFLPAPRFDHTLLLAERDGRELWLEPTPGRVDFGYLPAHLQGNHGLVLDAERPRLVQLPVLPLERNEDRGRISGRLLAVGDLEMTVESVLTGDYAHEARDFCAELDQAQRIEVLSSRLAERLPGVRIEGLELADVERLDRPVRETLALRVTRWSREAGRFRLVRVPWRFFVSSSPVGHETRDRGLLMGNRRRESETIDLELPEGFRLAGGALSVSRELPAAAYVLELASAGGRLTGRRVFEVRERVVWPEAYDAIKGFLEEVARDDQRDLVFEVVADPASA